MTHTTIDVPKFDDVEFDETTHTYRVNGVVLPSVTTVMKPLSSSFYEAVDAGTLSNAADRGTAVHQAIENFLEYGIEDIPPEHAGYFAAFKAFLADKNPIIIATETKLYHKFLRYAGTADLLCIIDGKVHLIDYKTTSVLVDMLVGVQLEHSNHQSFIIPFDRDDVVLLDKIMRNDINHLIRDIVLGKIKCLKSVLFSQQLSQCLFVKQLQLDQGINHIQLSIFF